MTAVKAGWKTVVKTVWMSVLRSLTVVRLKMRSLSVLLYLFLINIKCLLSFLTILLLKRHISRNVNSSVTDGATDQHTLL